MAVTAQEVKELRDRTGAGMMDCKRALQETDGDIDAAVDVLRTRGEAKVAKRSAKEASEGRVGSYIHFGGRIGVLVEVNCETDFVAKTDDFEELVDDVAMHVAASDPIAVSRDDVPEDVAERERKILRDQAAAEGKPEEIQEKIVEGRMRKFYEENVLLDQPFVKDTEKTVDELVTEVSAKTGEKIVIRRFARFELGEFDSDE